MNDYEAILFEKLKAVAGAARALFVVKAGEEQAAWRALEQAIYALDAGEGD